MLQSDSHSDWQMGHENRKIRGIVDIAMDRAWPFTAELDDELNIVERFIKVINWGQMIPLTRFWGESEMFMILVSCIYGMG